MSNGIMFLHSHSGIERELRLKKREVLVDEQYESMFSHSQPVMYNSHLYYKVNTLEFVSKGGVFKNFNR